MRYIHYGCTLLTETGGIYELSDCVTKMEEGAAVIHGTAIGILIIGFSWMKLFFRPPEARFWKNDVEVMSPDQRKIAFRCNQCGGLFIEQTPWMGPAKV